MKYNFYGTSGKKVSRLGFGGMRFEDPKDEEKMARLVVSAAEKGINYFDTAPYYCQDRSENIMGLAIQEMKKRKLEFVISSKSGAKTAEHVRKDLERSLKRLNVDALDFYHIWCVMDSADWQKRKENGVLDEFRKAKEEGLIRHLVFSAHMPGSEIQEVLETEPVEGVLLGYNALNFTYREEGLNAALKTQKGAVVMNPLGGGLIPQNEDQFNFLKKNDNQNILEAALHFLWSNPAITTTLVGFRHQQDLESALAAEASFQAYQKQEIDQIKNSLNEEFNQLCTTCMYCKGCPQGIDVWKFMEAANLYFFKNAQAPLDRLKYHWQQKADVLKQCTECGLCESKCTQKIPIMERFERLKKESEADRGN